MKSELLRWHVVIIHDIVGASIVKDDQRAIEGTDGTVLLMNFGMFEQVARLVKPSLAHRALVRTDALVDPPVDDQLVPVPETTVAHVTRIGTKIQVGPLMLAKRLEPLEALRAELTCNFQKNQERKTQRKVLNSEISANNNDKTEMHAQEK